MRESWVGMLGGAIVLLFILMAIFAPLIAPYDPNQPILPFAFPGDAAPDGGTFLLGTDHQGRDLLSRIMWGAQRVLFYATAATVCAYVVGIIMGLLAGYYRGWADELISFFANVILSFPVMVLYVLIIAKLGASGANIIFAVVFASSPGIMRIVRGLTLDIATRDYVVAAQTRGESTAFICLVEILPNARGPLIVDFCLRMGYTTITIGALGFLGLGLPPPDPDWGGMITETRAFITGGFPHMAIIPAIAVSLLVLGFNMLADGMREVASRD
ncbi:MAG: ABC transporter permease [Gammaproteobacteria bacterium]|nr:ABC transporter permease [Gammaproteobacteria bacterium]